jgi:glycolate oxidase iron-sulfur subunit
LTGYVQDLVYPDINRDTVDVLLANDCEVITPRAQPCCGSLHALSGDIDAARRLARRTIDQFDLEKIDAIISNAGGCGSHLKHDSHLFANDPAYARRAELWDRKVNDIHEWLVEVGFRPPCSSGTTRQNPISVTYHESYHLRNSQKISQQPRQQLRSPP